MTSIVEVIQHYQRSIDCSQDNEARLLHCIDKLYKLPIKVEHLQETGVGKTVNSLRKFNGEIGVAAKALVTKWKAMVTAEEEPKEVIDMNGDSVGATNHDDDDDENHNGNSSGQKRHHTEDSNDKYNERSKNPSSSNSRSHKNSSKNSMTIPSSQDQNIGKDSKTLEDKQKSPSGEKSKSSSYTKHKDKERGKEKNDHKSSRDKDKQRDHDKEKNNKKRDEKPKSDEGQKVELLDSTHSSQLKRSSHKTCTKSKHESKHSHSSSSKDKERSDKHKSSSKEKERMKDEKTLHHTSSSDKSENKSPPTSSCKFATKDPDSSQRKRHNNSDNESTDFKSPQSKLPKLSNSSSLKTASNAESSLALMATEENGVDDSFDSSRGANFDDVLGMLNMPVKKSKKSLKSPSPFNANKDNATISHRPFTDRSCISITPRSNSASPPSTSKASNKKPDLLAPTAKLEPLDPSIVFELPTISTNYKPMPLNQTVMDCVFNTSSSSSKPIRTLSDAEAITHGISSKTMRYILTEKRKPNGANTDDKRTSVVLSIPKHGITGVFCNPKYFVPIDNATEFRLTKIYSGVRTGQTFQVPSLFDMCIRLLQKNIDALEYTGGVPFDVLKPVLERATPQQLYVFEEYNPYLMEDSDILWQQHVSRNYRTKKRLENESWREMFIRCQEEEERRLSVLKDSIKASQKIAAAPVRKTQLAFIDAMVKPPRNILKKQEQFGTRAKLVATPAARVASLSSMTPNAAKIGDQRLKVPQTVRDNAQVSSSSIRPKKAPLMQKTLQFIRGRHKR